MRYSCLLTLSASLFLLPNLLGDERPWRNGAVATVHPLATEAGVQVLREGGNAIDAAIAAALMLGVVDGHNSGLGGGCFILIRSADGTVTAIDGRETAPALATRDMYRTPEGGVNEAASKDGALAVGTPGALAAYALAVKKHGRKPLGELILPAARRAAEGFPLDGVYARKISATMEKLKALPETRRLFFKDDGTALQKGDTLKQPDLARLLKEIAGQGPDAFYKGPFARQVDQWMQANQGVLREADFAGYEAKVRDPLRTTYRGYEILGFPPPGSGGVHVAQILNLLERYDLARFGRTDRLHVMAEAMKLAFADRAHWLGDPDFVPVPRGLLDKNYAGGLAEKITPGGQAARVPGHHVPPDAGADVFGDRLKHTTHLSAADAEGNWVAITQTINTAFGSKVIVPGTGVLLNNEMDDFAVAPGVPNAFKLVGAEANAVAPGKRPLSSMSPTLVLKEGQPLLSVGGAGGPTIISQTVQHLVGVLDLGLTLSEALAAPRLHHQWSPDELRMETGFGPEAMEAMKQRGHAVRAAGAAGLGVSQGVRWDAATRAFEPAHDPRVPGAVAGW
jgi:gamma-glutamyltranspeptidase/glutathione hydrolase